MIEYAEIMYVPDKKAAFVNEATRCFAEAKSAFSDNSLLQIYAGENLPWPTIAAPDPRAPAWANSQRRALECLHDVIRWWIAERQIPNGEFGGAWGDDVEMWRWWAPVLIGFADPIVDAAQRRLADGNLRRPALADGYTRELTDVEHTAEETADTITPMLHLAAHDPAWAERAERLLALADELWWGKNEQGKLQFRHIDFNSRRLGTDPGRAYDTALHLRVVEAALLLWQHSKDPGIGRKLTSWFRTWAEAAASTDNGKPAGIVPAALRWPDGLVGSERRGWIGPDLGNDPMTGIYSWPHHPVAEMTTALLQTYELTGDTTYLDPLMTMARRRAAHLADGDRDGPVGSAAWADHRLGQVVSDALAKWRQLHADGRFDHLLLADANGYVRFRLANDETTLARELEQTARLLSYNWPMFTTETRFTDRVLAFNTRWPPAVETFGRTEPIDTGMLYSMVTGDLGGVQHFPLNAVRWLAEPRDLAIRVIAADHRQFVVEIYSFCDQPRTLEAKLLLLQPGNYRFTLSSSDGQQEAESVTLSATERRLKAALPSRTLVRLSMTPNK